MGKSSAGKLTAVLLTVATLMFVAWPGGAAAAQGQIEVSNNQAIVQFPVTVTFKIDATAPAKIAEVTLTYGTDARSCQSGGSKQRVRIEPGTDVQVEWEWELKHSGSIPPGALIWWTWTLQDEAGNTFTTEREELVVRDARHDWRSAEQGGVAVNWFLGDEAFGQEVLSTAVSEIARLSAEIGVNAPEGVQLWLYPSANDVREALVISAEWTGAVAFPDYQIMIIGLAPGQASWAAEVIPHELTHLIVGVATHNCRGGYLPVWLSEGLAVYGEGAVSADDLDQLETALQEERLLSLRDLADGFSAYGGGARLAYAQSGEVVRFMLEQYGPEQMDALLSAIREGLSIDRALERVLGFDTDELDARWRSAQGYAATPTSAASQALKDATPTAVPTLPMVGAPLVSTPTPTPEPASATPRPSPSATPPPAVESQPSPAADGSPAAVVAANEPPIVSPSPAPPSTAEKAASGTNSLPLIVGIGLGVLVLLVGAFIVLRKGE